MMFYVFFFLSLYANISSYTDTITYIENIDYIPSYSYNTMMLSYYFIPSITPYYGHTTPYQDTHYFIGMNEIPTYYFSEEIMQLNATISYQDSSYYYSPYRNLSFYLNGQNVNLYIRDSLSNQLYGGGLQFEKQNFLFYTGFFANDSFLNIHTFFLHKYTSIFFSYPDTITCEIYYPYKQFIPAISFSNRNKNEYKAEITYLYTPLFPITAGVSYNNTVIPYMRLRLYLPNNITGIIKFSYSDSFLWNIYIYGILYKTEYSFINNNNLLAFLINNRFVKIYGEKTNTWNLSAFADIPIITPFFIRTGIIKKSDFDYVFAIGLFRSIIGVQYNNANTSYSAFIDINIIN